MKRKAYEKYLGNNMDGSILPVGMVWNYIGETGSELNRCLHQNINIEFWKYLLFLIDLNFMKKGGSQ